MTVFLSRRYHFSASHRLNVDSLTDAENREAFGKCNNPHGHGHNYAVTIRLSGSIDPETGMVANLADLDQFASTHLLAVYDESNLNLLPAFQTVVPTTENLAIELFRIFKPFPDAHLESVHVEETGNNSFTYFDLPIRIKPERTAQA